MSLAGPDITFCMIGSGRMAAAAPRISGPADLEVAVGALIDHWDMSRMTTKRLYVDGDTVIAHRSGVIRHNPTGKDLETEYIDVFTVKDGKIDDITEFVDTLMVAEAIGLVTT
ncbi:MAG TPA: nuclear transport factor 2 family protein [Pararhizobium sp.]|uniref:nuclear transport factor 2 family protein n=1 Tax=Pararhizobium sp. TaxID=1977563 RepID=UPI002C133BCB|nr:nuclear transport factor 2 family protein [Pararhizobium sp.]HTO31304.1 nuclear transport factor 2 family protein [Pararhizobium sp.]